MKQSRITRIGCLRNFPNFYARKTTIFTPCLISLFTSIFSATRDKPCFTKLNVDIISNILLRFC